MTQRTKNKYSGLLSKIQTAHAKIGIVGLGYVGLPLAALAAKKGFSVLGIDIDGAKVAKISKGDSHIQDLSSDDLKALIVSKRLSATTNWDMARECDILILCVPTPFNRNREPDLTPVITATREISSRLRKDQLIILESTTYPGTTQELMLPMLEESGLTVGRDFFLGYSPERVDPGNTNFKVQDIPKVIGGTTLGCRDLAAAFYQQIVPSIALVSSTQAAELSKLLENIFRNVNIALVNELAMLCDRMKVNVWEVIEAAATKPFGFMSFSPGPGVGGHCIPVDPVYLSWKAKEYDFYTNFIDLAAEVNSNMPYFVVRKLQRLLYQRRQNFPGKKVLVLGITFKKNIDDMRNSSALKFLEIMNDEAIAFNYHDPFVPEIRLNGQRLKSVELTEKILSRAACVLIHTDHDNYDWKWIVKHSRLVFDTRNATKKVKNGLGKIYRL
ncbi:MAG: nucleotide sugar dehydrogenase [Elusimicrobia bacterium]|nr:nucleotide sugar dehydrogenase [Elusimicrobiota bacterium]